MREVIEARQQALPQPLWTRSLADPPVGGTLKRGFDFGLAVVMLVVLLPAMCLIALFIRGTYGGPVFYRQTRVGINGTAFECLKFRTMANDADARLQQLLRENPTMLDEWRSTRKLKRDPRVTSFGRLLRLTSLDELPQLINIARGEMSFVGPRPIVSDEVESYGAYIADYMRVRPGLTGLWQISGRNDASYKTRVLLDAYYVRHWSMRADIIIILKTIPAVLTSRGCY